MFFQQHGQLLELSLDRVMVVIIIFVGSALRLTLEVHTCETMGGHGTHFDIDVLNCGEVSTISCGASSFFVCHDNSLC